MPQQQTGFGVEEPVEKPLEIGGFSNGVGFGVDVETSIHLGTGTLENGVKTTIGTSEPKGFGVDAKLIENPAYTPFTQLFEQRDVIRQQRRSAIIRRNIITKQDWSADNTREVEATVQSQVPLPQPVISNDETIWRHQKTPYDPHDQANLFAHLYRNFFLHTDTNLLQATSTITQSVIGIAGFGSDWSQRWQADIEKWKDSQLVHNFAPAPDEIGDVNNVLKHQVSAMPLVRLVGDVANVMLMSEVAGVAAGKLIPTGGSVASLSIDAAKTALARKFGGAVGASIAAHFGSELETEQKLSDLRYVTIDGKQQVVTIDQARQLHERGGPQAQPVYTPQQAKDQARGLALATFPLSIAANVTFLPVAQALGGKSFADSFIGSAVDGALNNTVGSLATGLPQRAWQYHLGAYESAGKAIEAAFEDGKHGFLMGGVMGGGLNLLQRALPNGQSVKPVFRELTGVDLDSYSPRHAYLQLTQELKLDPKEAQLAVSFWDHTIQTGVESGRWNSVEDGWLRIHAGLSEQSKQNFDDLSGVVLQQNASSSDAIFTKLRKQVLDLDSKGKWTGQQMISTLENKGARQDEMTWSGLKTYLFKAQDENKQVSRKDMAEFLDTRQLRINVIKKTDEAVPDQEFQQLFRAYENADKAFTEASNALDKPHTPEQDPELRQAKDQTQKAFREAENLYHETQRRQSESQTQYGFVSPSGPRAHYEEWLFQLPVEFFEQQPKTGHEKAGDQTPIGTGTKFNSAHFDDPNIIVHMRVDERVDPQTGKKYLNLIELQSDWHQQGRESGYAGEVNKFTKDTGEVIPDSMQVANAPFQKDWPDLALAHFLKESILRGYDQIAWQPGFMQDRFQGAAESGRAEFYDKIVMNKLLTLARKLDPGVNVGEVHLDTQSEEAKRGYERLSSDENEKIPSISVTPKMRESLASGRDLMAQPVEDPYFEGEQLRGLALILKSGRGLIKGFASADKSTGLHELFHLARFFMLKNGDMQFMQRALSKLEHSPQELQDKGWSDGWTRKMEEGFVGRFLQYVEEGRAPKPELIPFFDKFSKVLGDLKKSANEGTVISPAMRGVFDRIVEADTYPIYVAREMTEQFFQKLQPAEESLKAAQELSNADPSDPAKKLAALQEEADIKGLRDDYYRAEQDLKNAQEAYRGPGAITRQEQNAKDWAFSQQQYTPPDMQRRLMREGILGKAATIWRELWGAFKTSDVLGKNPTAYKFVSMLERTYNLSREIMGKYHLAIWHYSYKGLSAEENAWLQGTAEGAGLPQDSGLTRLRRLTDEVGLVPDKQKLTPEDQKYLAAHPNIEKWLDLSHWVFGSMIDHAIDEDVMRRLKSGEFVYPEKQYQGRLPRLVSPEAINFLEASTPSRDRLIAELAKENGKTVKFVEGELQQMSARKDRVQGSIELSRTLPYFPDMWEGNHVFVSQPTKLLEHYVFRVANRLAKIRVLGAGQLENVYMNKDVMYNVLDAGGVLKPKNLKVDLVDRAITAIGFDKNYWSVMTKDQLKQVLEKSGVNVEENVDQVYVKMLGLRTEHFNTLERESRLRDIAKQLGGIDSQGPLAKVLYEVKDRVSRDIDDNLTQRFKDSYHKEGQGGDPALIEKMVADMQGIPRRQVLDGNRKGRAWEVISSIWSGLQTSYAVVGQVAGTLTHVGMPEYGNSFKALITTLNDFKSVSDKMAMLGVFQHTTPIWTGEASHWSTGLVKMLRNLGGQLLLTDRGREWATAVGGQAGEYRAKQLIDKGFSWWGNISGEKARARVLGLNENDIRMIEANQKGEKMTARQQYELTQKLSINTANKFIGGELASPSAKSSVELDPLKSSILKYMRFGFEAQRTGHALIDEMAAGLTTGDLKKAIGGMSATLQFLVNAVGAGMTAKLLATSISGKTLPENREDWEKAAKDGLVNAGVLGPVALVLHNMTYQGNDSGADMLVSSSAAFKPIADMLAAVAGRGPLGKFPWYDRYVEVLKQNTPLYKAVSQNIENLAYPEHKTYIEVKKGYRDWLATNPEYWLKQGETWSLQKQPDPDSGSGQVNPVYADMKLAADRMDAGELSGAIAEYTKKQMAAGVIPLDVYDRARASLLANSPLPGDFDNPKILKYLSSLPVDKRLKATMTKSEYEKVINQVIPPIPHREIQ